MSDLCRTACAAASVLLSAQSGADDWTHLANSPNRVAIIDARAPSINQPIWIASLDRNGDSISFIGQAGPVAHDGFVYAFGKSNGQHWIYSIDVEDGTVDWQEGVPAPFFGSFSSPVLDAANATIIVAAGNLLLAFDAKTGVTRWQHTLDQFVVNASPVVTNDLGAANRLFITDYSFGPNGKLYCLNVDPFHATDNPHQPGDRVWSIPIGSTSGNTPAYYDSCVYVATTGSPGPSIRSYPADADGPPSPNWTYPHQGLGGFYGGLVVSTYVRPVSGQIAALVPESPSIYAASYHFNCAEQCHINSELVSLDATTGALRWSENCSRTDSIPIPLPDGRVVLAGGLDFLDTVPSVQLFDESGGVGELIWDLARETWTDIDGDGVIEPEEVEILAGGWTHQPVLFDGGPTPVLCVGSIPLGQGSFSDPCTDLRLLDLSKSPNDPGFVIDHFVGAGSTPAFADGILFTVGAAGLHAFGPEPSDVNGDGVVDVEDLHAWEQGSGARDVNNDGIVDQDDREALIGTIRSSEADDMRFGQR